MAAAATAAAAAAASASPILDEIETLELVEQVRRVLLVELLLREWPRLLELRKGLTSKQLPVSAGRSRCQVNPQVLGPDARWRGLTRERRQL